MAVETELYIAFPDDMLDKFGLVPAVLYSDGENVQKSLDLIQRAATAAQTSMRVLRITEAELMYKITPEARDEDEDEVDEDLPTGIQFGGTRLIW